MSVLRRGEHSRHSRGQRHSRAHPHVCPLSPWRPEAASSLPSTISLAPPLIPTRPLVQPGPSTGTSGPRSFAPAPGACLADHTPSDRRQEGGRCSVRGISQEAEVKGLGFVSGDPAFGSTHWSAPRSTGLPRCLRLCSRPSPPERSLPDPWTKPGSGLPSAGPGQPWPTPARVLVPGQAHRRVSLPRQRPGCAPWAGGRTSMRPVSGWKLRAGSSVVTRHWMAQPLIRMFSCRRPRSGRLRPSATWIWAWTRSTLQGGAEREAGDGRGERSPPVCGPFTGLGGRLPPARPASPAPGPGDRSPGSWNKDRRPGRAPLKRLRRPARVGLPRSSPPNAPSPRPALLPAQGPSVLRPPPSPPLIKPDLKPQTLHTESRVHYTLREAGAVSAGLADRGTTGCWEGP